MSDENNEDFVADNGVPFEPSDTVFRKFIKKGKSVEEAEELAIIAAEARANTVDGWLRHQLKMGWKKLTLWIGGMVSAFTAALFAAGTEKINALISIIVG